AGTTVRVSVSSAGKQGNDQSAAPAISADGRFVAFNSDARNLVPDDTNNRGDVFVRDTESSTTTRVSVGAEGEQADGVSSVTSLSPDGRYVVFESQADNLVAGDGNGVSDVFVRDTLLQTTLRVSVATAGTAGNAPSGAGRISADGRWVAFSS